ncbi:OST-HTH/LOTUS domain-containing protein [Ensifer sp. YR511]|uniref:OST-HTH/LOTUS domain-containing protein n=1 Tax=Ensifer sp. YR511 TaxID=1855294 RepID=UPI000B2086BA
MRHTNDSIGSPWTYRGVTRRDSDFARLAARIRHQGVTVYGFGERKTPRPFITACDNLVYFDLLNAAPEEIEEATVPYRQKPTEVKPAAAKPVHRKTGLDMATGAMLTKAVIATADEDGRANLTQVGGHLAKRAPDLDARNQGFPRLRHLVKASGLVDVERAADDTKTILVRLKMASVGGTGRTQEDAQRRGWENRNAPRTVGATFCSARSSCIGWRTPTMPTSRVAWATVRRPNTYPEPWPLQLTRSQP